MQPAVPTHNRRTKSFLSMISPIKNRSSSVVEEREENEGKARSAVKAGKGESHARGKVSKCISSIKETVNYLNDNVKKIRDKSHGLAVLFNPVLNRLTDPSDPLAKYSLL